MPKDRSIISWVVCSRGCLPGRVGVVDEHVHRAERVHGGRADLGGTRLLRDVGGEIADRIAEFRRERVARLVVDVDDQNLGAFLRERPRDPSSDTPAPPVTIATFPSSLMIHSDAIVIVEVSSYRPAASTIRMCVLSR